MKDKSQIGRGVRQGCYLSPTLFNIYLENIINSLLDGTRGVSVAIVIEKEQILKQMLVDLNTNYGDYGMRVNVKKTKHMVISSRGKKIQVRVNGELVQQFKSFNYLGSVIQEGVI